MNKLSDANEKRDSLIRQTIESQLPPSFVRDDSWEWSRDHTWRQDHIYTVMRKESFAVNAQVIIPPIPNTEYTCTSLALENLPALSKRSDVLYRFPLQNETLAQLSDDLGLALTWFEKFDTPRKCLEYIERDSDRNLQSIASKYCRDYLQALL